MPKDRVDVKQNLVFETFDHKDQDEVKRLILAGLAEHWGELDLSKNPDLDDIASSYAGGTFLVARQSGEIVATGALVPRGGRIAEVVRISVARSFRRQGVGLRMLAQLCATAKQQGFRRLVLETTDSWHEAIAFYERFGFKATHCQNGSVFFSLDLQ